MKRVVSLITVFLLCVALAIPALAAEEFVPSITAKPAPELNVGGSSIKVDGTGTEGEEGTGVPVVEVKNEKDETVYSAPVADLIVTAVSQVVGEGAAEELVISEEAAEILKEAYDELNEKDFKLSEAIVDVVKELEELLVAQVVDEVTAVMEVEGATEAEIETAVEAAVEVTKDTIADIIDNAVVTALFDVTILSEELQSYLDVEGNTIDLTFEADIPEGNHVFVMVFKNNEWQLIENVVINGDGTITCTFAHFCPVAILTAPIVEVEKEETEEPTEAPTEAPAEEPTEAPTEAPTETPVEKTGFPWWIIVVVVVAGVIVLVTKKGAKKK